jgi:hypothetical protein
MAMTDKNNNYKAWNDLLTRVRKTALSVARRGTVICDAHLPSGGIVVNGRLLFDFVSFLCELRNMSVPTKRGTREILFGCHLWENKGWYYAKWLALR